MPGEFETHVIEKFTMELKQLGLPIRSIARAVIFPNMNEADLHTLFPSQEESEDITWLSKEWLSKEWLSKEWLSKEWLSKEWLGERETEKWEKPLSFPKVWLRIICDFFAEKLAPNAAFPTALHQKGTHEI